MISAFRRYLNTWVVRGFFLILVAAFATWGIGDVIRSMGTDTWLAKVGDRTIEPTELDGPFRAAMARYSRANPGAEASGALRRQIAQETLQELILRVAVDQETRRLGVGVPDADLRQSVFDIPAFRGPSGQFDRQVFETLLRNNGLTEAGFLALQREDLARRQVLEAVSAGVAVPDVLTRQAFDYQAERRSADMVEFPFAAVPPPAPPDEAVLMRWHQNHPWLYSTPEFRRIKAVVLAPQTIAKDVPVTDEELHKLYDQHTDEFVVAARRSVQVMLVNDEAKARALADKWRAGADWPAMQEAAKADGGSAVDLDKVTEQAVPVPELAKAVFAAPPQAVSDPLHGPLGWNVFRVTDVVPGSERTFDQVKDELRDRLVAERAADLLYDRANKLDNILGTGASLDEIPSDLGAAAITGSLDAEGNTLDGKPAPIPGPPELRSAIISAAFQLPKGEPPHLVEVPTPKQGGSAYYAMTVEEIIPPAVEPFDEVREKVLADWTANQIQRVQDAASTKLRFAIDKGQSIADAALVAGATVHRTPLVDRSSPVEGMPAALQRVLFGLKKGEAAQVQTPDGFVVAVPAEIQIPEPQQQPEVFANLRARLSRETADDLQQVFADALRARANPRINPTVLDQFVRP
jgi:peptidyl-prolyl cis-trans isomerase D